MSSAQVGKTEILLNILGYYIDQDPAPILLVQPTLEMAQAFSKDRLAPMVRDTPALTHKVSEAKGRTSGNTMLHKTFPGGHCTIAGSNSPSGLASRPCRIVLADEISRYPVSAGTEGDPVLLARKRSATFWNRKTVLTSTPTIKRSCRIELAFEESDQRRYHVPCPHCDEHQVLQWSNVHWEDKDPESTVYVCHECGGIINDHSKLKMLQAGEWRATVNDGAAGVAGFHLNELYSPWRRWSEVVADFLEAKKTPETLKTWVNTSLGETWEDEGEKMTEGDLTSRRESFDADSMPDDVILLTAGTDVQKDRLEVSVVGWNEYTAASVIEHKVLIGDTAKPQVWDALDKYLLSDFGGLRIVCAGVDRQFRTNMVDEFTRKRTGRMVHGFRGESGPGRPAVSAPRHSGKTRTIYFLIGVDTLKDNLQARLQADDYSIRFSHTLEEEYFKQLTAEKCKIKHRNGSPYRVWEPSRDRNEALDCFVYAWAALYLLDVDWPRLIDNRRRVKVTDQDAPRRPLAKPKAKKSNFVTSWG